MASKAKQKKEVVSWVPPQFEKVVKLDVNGERLAVSADMLVLNGVNMRRDHVPDKALMASLDGHGQLHDLIVRPAGEKFEIVDGGRRYVSICELIKDEKLPGDFGIRVRVDAEASKEISVAANLHKAPHPLDVCEAIAELAKELDSEEQIAAHFGQTVQWVKQRAVLAGLSPEAKEAYRQDRMTLGVAQKMSRLTHKLQAAICKRAKGGTIYDSEVSATLNGEAIDSAHALFDWKTLYPPEKVQPSLFDDIVLLYDRQLFQKFQAEAVKKRCEALEAEGYNIVHIERDDYAASGKWVAFEGKITDEMKKSLSILVKPAFDGVRWDFTGPVISRKLAEATKKKKGEADTTDKAPKALKASDLSSSQVEILRGHAFMELREKILSNDKETTPLVQWVIISLAVDRPERFVERAIADTHNGPTMRWEKLKKDYPGEFDAVDLDKATEELDRLTFEKFQKMPPAKREALVRQAVACCLFVTQSTDERLLKIQVQAIGSGKPRLGEAFFKRYRSDQLVDWLKKAGVPKAEFEGKNKTQLVALCLKTKN